jgi:hypothetical protein
MRAAGAGGEADLLRSKSGHDPGRGKSAGRLAAKYHWHSIVLVTITPQDSRARLRFERCFNGKVYVMTGPIHAYRWPYEIAYGWGAIIKAPTVQRSC